MARLRYLLLTVGRVATMLVPIPEAGRRTHVKIRKTRTTRKDKPFGVTMALILMCCKLS